MRILETAHGYFASYAPIEAGGTQPLVVLRDYDPLTTAEILCISNGKLAYSCWDLVAGLTEAQAEQYANEEKLYERGSPEMVRVWLDLLFFLGKPIKSEQDI